MRMEQSEFDPAMFAELSSDPTVEEPVIATDLPVTTTVEPEPVPIVEPIVAEPVIEEVEYKDLTPRERSLLDRLEKVTGERLDAVVPTPTTESPATPIEPTAHNFLDGVDIDEVLSSSENLNKLLVAVYNRALADAVGQAKEYMLKSAPQVITQYTTQHLAMRELVDQFYRDNHELASIKRTVAAVANEIAADKPELSMSELFKEAGERVYKMLGLKRGTTTVTAPTTIAKRALVTPRGTSVRMQAPALEGVAADISDLFGIR